MTGALVHLHRGQAPAHAGLGSSTDSGFCWLEWPEPTRSVDAAVPRAVRSVIAEALSRAGLVTFIVDQAYPAMVVRPVRQNGLARLFNSKLRQGSTRDVGAIEHIFEDPGQAWWLGSAVAVVTNPDLGPPCVGPQTWAALAGDQWISVAKEQALIAAVLRAGTDGEMAGWWSRSAALGERFAASFAAANSHLPR